MTSQVQMQLPWRRLHLTTVPDIPAHYSVATVERMVALAQAQQVVTFVCSRDDTGGRHEHR
ncbi:hypothetical protein [Limnohabitans sp.]|uniref:hypothetical protein n=1 Tax=Limnohabitans sp. TaxID=1907725 RepID=UPI0038BAD0D7